LYIGISRFSYLDIIMPKAAGVKCDSDENPVKIKFMRHFALAIRFSQWISLSNITHV
jgi:hypothetical protein